MSQDFKGAKIASLFKELAAEYIQKESWGDSMITITRVRHLGDKIVFLCSVLPQDKETSAISFLKRKRSEVREYLQTKSKMRNIPIIDFDKDEELI